jgi:hypothetical protein
MPFKKSKNVISIVTVFTQPKNPPYEVVGQQL